jgi:thiosulfate reductase cytochrome b subunit
MPCARLWHWGNAVVVIVMLMSGATISNAHRFLYWGQKGAMPEEAWLRLPRFPGWMTIPSRYDLSSAREWHLAFAWLFAFGLGAFLAGSLLNGHIGRDFRLGRPGSRYHSLQKLVYCGLLFGMLPLADWHRAYPVPGHECGLAVAAGPVRRAAIGADDPLLAGWGQ